MELSFSLDLTQVQTQLANLETVVRDFSEPFANIGDDLLDYYGQQVFDNQGVAGDQWQELSAETIKMRAMHWGYYKNESSESADKRILVWTGNLMKGFKKEAGPMSLRIYNDVPYFQYHQLSQRKMLALTSDIVTQVTMALNDYLLKSINAL